MKRKKSELWTFYETPTKTIKVNKQEWFKKMEAQLEAGIIQKQLLTEFYKKQV
jgi:hypothetical protein